MQEQRIKYLETLVAEEPDEPFNQYALAMEYLQSHPQKALEQLTVIVSNFPDYLPTYYQLSTLLMNTEQLEKAFELAENGIALAIKQKNDKAFKELTGLKNLIADELDQF